MITRHPARTSWSRRDVLRGSAAALMGAYGLAPRYGLAADIPTEYDGSKFQMRSRAGRTALSISHADRSPVLSHGNLGGPSE